MKKRLLPVFISCLLLAVVISGCKKDIENKVPVVDAGKPDSIVKPVDSVTLTGTATDADGKITAYLWSEVTGPSAVTIVDPGSSSTIVSGFKVGTYIFQLMAVDNDGATGVDTVSIIVKPSAYDTLIFQPADNPAEVHIWGNSTDLEESSTGVSDLGAAYWTSNGDSVGMRGALKFDLSAIQASANILSANLTLYSNPTPSDGNLVDANFGTDNSFLIQQITSPWVASAVKWTNQPAVTSANQIVIASTTQSFLDVTADVTTMTKDMVKNNTNYGFLLRLQTEQKYNSRIFCSSKYTDSNKHPKLVVIIKN